MKETQGMRMGQKMARLRHSLLSGSAVQSVEEPPKGLKPELKSARLIGKVTL